MEKMRRYYLIIAMIVFSANTFSQNRNQFKIANQYHQNSEWNKAVSLYKTFTQENIPLNSYYQNYLDCLIKMESFSDAEKIVRKMQKKFPENVKYKIDLGFVWKAKGLKEKANKQFSRAIKSLRNNQANQINSIANSFAFKGEHEFALKTYQRGKTINPKKNYQFQIANVYRNLGETEMMINTLIELIKRDPSKKQAIQNTLQSSLNKTTGNLDNFKLLKEKLIKEIQQTNNIDFTEILIWVLLQEDKFSTALNHVKSLDKRLKENKYRIYDLANIAYQSQDYETAIKCYDYIIKHPKSKYYLESRILKMITHSEYVLSGSYVKNDLLKLEEEFQQTLEELGSNISTAYLLKEYGRLIGFYLNNIDKSIEILLECIRLTNQNPELQAKCKLDLGDLFLINQNPWESILLYSQVEKDFKENPIGHEAKFRRAKISYFQGNFDWAQAQLDVLKASTSKLIANNAMDLSLLITDNIGLDTSSHVMKMYARAELMIFQNQLTKGSNILDSIINTFHGHSLIDEVLYKKGELELKIKNYKKAISYFKEVSKNYSFEILADDALFKSAELNEYYLNDKENAKLMYEDILLNHPGSIYTNEARKRYRILRGDNTKSKL